MSFGKKKSSPAPTPTPAPEPKPVAQQPVLIAPVVPKVVPAAQPAPNNAGNIYTSRKKGTTTSFAGLYSQQAATARKTLLGQ